MPITLNLEPDDALDLLDRTDHCTLTLLREATVDGLPGVVIKIDERRCAVTLREFLSAARGLRAKAETWPEWQQADTP